MAKIISIPALADVHVHLREPGFSYKETILSGSAAAAAGGFSCICPMPNLDPVPDSPANLQAELDIIRRDALIDVIPYAAITVGRAGRRVVDIASLVRKPDAASGQWGAVAFSDDGSGVQDENTMLEAMRAVAKAGAVLAAHCEDNSLLRGGYINDGIYAREHGHQGICAESEWTQIERDLELAEFTGCAYHVCHISTARSVEAIRRAKARGIDVTCETAPHYLTLCDDDLQEDGRFKMNPPLRSSADRSALIEGLLDGTIDMIATDHAPHSAEEKSRGLKGSAMGVVGLETSFPVMYSHFVHNGLITLERLVELMSTNPRRRFRLPAAEGCTAEFDIGTPWTVDPSGFKSKGRSTPFEGVELLGRCLRTVIRGREVFRLGSPAPGTES